MLNESTAAHQFQVDLRGVIDLLSRHIYSGPRVYLRELLQNAVDAIAARRALDGSGGRVRITPVSAASDEFVIRDDGIGLSAEEVADMLATVGHSSKRDIFDLPRSDYLGQFGIGMLSCFMVCDTIVIRSRSAAGAPPVEWIGRADGTFTVAAGADDLPVGTSVHLVPRAETKTLVSTPTVRELAETFAAYLPTTIVVDLPGGGESTVTTAPPFLSDDRETQLGYGRSLIGAEPLDVISLSVPGTQTRGVAYVLPYAPPPSARQSTRVYLRRMLLTERADDILPPWAFFARAVIDSGGLHPTASRESLVDDDALEQTRRELGDGIRRWILDLALHDPLRLAQFVAIHEVALKSLVRHDEELARFIVRWLSVETTQGRLRIEELVRRYPHVRYTETVDEFRQVASVTDAGTVLVDGGYVYDAELMRLVPDIFPGVTVEKVDVLDEIDRLDLPPLDDRAAALDLERRAAASLPEVDVLVRAFDRADLPGLFVSDPAVLRALDRGRARSAGGALWGGVLDRAAVAQGDAAAGSSPAARLCLNWTNDVVRRLAAAADGDVFGLSVRLLYVQSLLAGHHPLGSDDRALLTSSLSQLLGRALQAETAGADHAVTASPAPDVRHEGES
ncbi:HSP90 family protein [Microbacterium sp. VKM Ac-2870]|uniref:HSP90 family protein n=1 Tax=Microbacterium sp. VKM Ac-2870 TaxID=2783825 RepID=UPI00188CCF00|nr:HSP90 family protein [Microbacterium sp. VKM Ac-2870]MBF4563068.1 HSP90 family protein [Microbacterium sp. VKM Ac-2870]